MNISSFPEAEAVIESAIKSQVKQLSLDLATATSFLQPTVRKLRNDGFWIIYLLEHS